MVCWKIYISGYKIRFTERDKKVNVVKMTDEYARMISQWKYDGIYSFYDYDENLGGDFMDGTHFACINTDGELIGYFCYGNECRVPTVEENVYNDDYLDYGLGLRPDLCGKKNGLRFFNVGLEYAKKQYGAKKFRLSVAAFNERAVKLYKNAGFYVAQKVTNSYFKNEFLIMKYECES